MGSPPTLTHHETHHELATEALQLDPDDWHHGHVTAHLADQHPQVRTWPDDNPYHAHEQDHRDWIYDHPNPNAQRAADADELFRRANPDRAQIGTDPDPLRRRDLVRAVEDLQVEGYRVWYDQTLENSPTPTDLRHYILRQRAVAAQLPPWEAERAFDRLNPGFGVPADHTAPLGQQAVRDREAALALGTRVTVASSRENDRDPVIWLAGQDYRVADAIQAARTRPMRTRSGPER
jgi:hypothetical protein